MKILFKILKPFEQITNEMSSEKSITLSKVILVVRGLSSALNKIKLSRSTTAVLATKLIDNLLGSISIRFGNLENNYTLAKSAFLDPRFKNRAFSSEQNLEKVKYKIQEEIVTLINNDQQNQTENITISPKTSNGGPSSSTGNNSDGETTDLVWQDFDKSTKITTVSAIATAILEMRMYMEGVSIN